MIRIAFLAIAQAHQIFHWLPAALRLAKEPGVEVHVLSASRSALALIREFDPDRSLHLKRIFVPSLRRDGLFSPPKRIWALIYHLRLINGFDAIVTTERTSSILKRMPGFTAPVIHMMHGAGDRARGYNRKHRFFDLTLVGGEKNKERLVARGLRTPEQVKVTGYAKFEIVPPARQLFDDGRPIALYNPHFDPKLSSWHRHGREVLTELARIDGWNFIVAPHVKLSGGPRLTAPTANVLVDPGSMRSIDMSYTSAASVYIGDVSSQVYEFIRQPRPCIFLNLDRVEWQDDEHYAHWKFGQVIEQAAELGPALNRAAELQPQFEPVQRAALQRSIDPSPVPASERQAAAILEFVRTRRG
ncbi:glycosyl transferase [Sphingomonas sp. GCM10030256]|uniref:glycosyl transferase n=1 Tax=Sphingomonas sp. GCM10030256 TaxID=3273427 RepID=UPI00360D0571